MLVRDLDRFEDPALVATIQRIVRLKPDLLALQSVDYDHNRVALRLLQQRLEEQGHAMPHAFAGPPNIGVATGFDLNRDGQMDMAADRQGYGFFTGEGGISLLSRYPIDEPGVQDFTRHLWKDEPTPGLPEGYYSDAELGVLRLHNVGAWSVPLILPSGPLTVLITQLSPPVFDGPEDRNGLRNAAQLRSLANWADAQTGPFAIMGGLNNDPRDGEGLKPPLMALLGHPKLQDAKPRTEARTGLDARDTADWGRDIGSLRVDYILPSAGLRVVGAGVDWRGAATDGDTPHKPVWVDILWQ